MRNPFERHFNAYHSNGRYAQKLARVRSRECKGEWIAVPPEQGDRWRILNTRTGRMEGLSPMDARLYGNS